MSVTVNCDVCGAELGAVWGTFNYSPGGGRHGIESFQFCMDCVGGLRRWVADRVPKPTGIPARWMLYQDDREARVDESQRNDPASATGDGAAVAPKDA